MKRLMTMFAMVATAFGLCSSTFADAQANWFTETAQSVTLALTQGGETQDGVWSNLTDQVEVDAATVVVDADDETAVAYRPNAALRGNNASIILNGITFTAARKALPALEEVQAAVAITTNAEGACVFAVANGGTWEVTEKEAAIDAAYAVKVDLHYGEANTVDYFVDEGGQWTAFRTGAANPVTGVKASTVEFAGCGAFSEMSGELATRTISFTDVPEGIADIKVNGTSVDQDGKATVVEGAENVVIGFVAADGYRLSSDTVTLPGPIMGDIAYNAENFPVTVEKIAYVAQIVDGATTNKFETADEAFVEAAKAGGKVEIFAACAFTGSYVFTNADVEISVAADVTLTRSGTSNYPFTVYNRKTLTFSGEGTISKAVECKTSTLISIGKDDASEMDSDACGHVIVNGGNIIDEGGSNACSIDCGTFVMNGGYIRSGNADGHAVRVSSKIADGSAAVVTLNAGRLEAANSAIGVKIDSGKTPTITAVPGKDDTAIITGVKGNATYAGTITMKLDAGEGLLFSNNKSEFAPRGYGYVASETVTGWFKLGLATYTITAESGTIGGEASATYSMDKTQAQDFALVAAQPETGKKFKAWTLVATSVQGENVTIADQAAAETTLTVGAGAIGNYTVTATYEDILVTSVTLNKDKLELDIGTNETLVATVLPEGAADKTIAWTSSDDAIATVADGTVTAVAEGTATITATNAASGCFATCTVTVKAAAPDPVEPGADIDIPAGKDINDINTNDAVKAELLKAPGDIATTPAYRALFDAVAGSEAGKVAFVLNNAGTNAVVEAETAADTTVLDAALDADAETATVENPLVGFYYSLKQNADVTKLGFKEATDKNKLGGKDTIQFTLEKGEASEFYQMIVTPAPVK